MKYAPVLALSLLFPGVLFAADQIELIQIYGSLRPETIARSPEGGDLVRRMDDGYSRIGIKGETELSGALTGFYKYERRVSANDGEDDGAVRGDHNELRQVHAGVRGAFGAVSMGRHYGLSTISTTSWTATAVTTATPSSSQISSSLTRWSIARQIWVRLILVR